MNANTLGTSQVSAGFTLYTAMSQELMNMSIPDICSILDVLNIDYSEDTNSTSAVSSAAEDQDTTTTTTYPTQ